MNWADDPTTIRATAQQRLASYADGVTIETNFTNVIGDGVRDVQFLAYGPPANSLHLWFDTFKLENNNQPEWYAIHFPHPTKLNSVYWLHGPVFNEGGWWTSLAVQYQDADQQWHDVAQLRISPPYDFSDTRANRTPFAAFVARFDPVITASIRLIGLPSGTHSMTSMAYLAADLATEQSVTQHLEHINRPKPQLFHYLPPHRLWATLISIRVLTEIAFDVQTTEGLGLDHFLPHEQYQQFHEMQQSLHDPTMLYRMLGEYEGWNIFGKAMQEARSQAKSTLRPAMIRHHGDMIWLCIPIVSEGKVLATIENRNLIRCVPLRPAWHRRLIKRANFDSQQYRKALAAVPILTAEKLQGVIDFILNVASFSEEIVTNAIEVAQFRSIKLASRLMDQTKRSLIDLMGHELRTPLNAIIGYSEMLLEDEAQLSSEAFNDIKQIQHAGKHLLQLLSMILDIANIESGTMDVNLELFEPVEVLQEVSISLRSLFKKQGNRCSLQISPEINLITADKAKFRQIIFHLMNNANKFTHAGQVEVQIMLNPANHEQMLVIVKDTGIGIHRQHIPYLFTEFGQLDPSSTRKYGGTGMGLALSRHLARLMGGDITVTSELDVGSCFTLMLPIESR